MSNGDLNWITNFIWGIADDALRDLYVRGKYRDVILPMMVLRRLDAVLEPTKAAVLSMRDNLDKAGITNQDAALRQAAGQAFYNASRFNLRDLRNRASQAQLKADFEAFLDGFSPNVQEILDNFEFRNQLPKLSKADVLGTLIEKFLESSINLGPKPVLNGDGSVKHPGLDNHAMGTIFEELVRRFNEANNEEAGEHWTPRDAVKLMAKLIFVPIADQIQSGTYLLYDGACGTGGMLTVAEATLNQLASQHGKQVSTHLFGQEINGETYAIAKADLLLKGEGDEADNIVGGPEWSTLANDAFPSKEFDFMLSNPPYGKSWKSDQERMGGKAGIRDPRFVIEHAGDAEYSLVTRSSDGQMLFLANLLSKMKHNTPLGSRIAEPGGIETFKPSARVDVGFFQYLLKSHYIQALQATSNFIRDGQDLNMSNFALVDLPLPPKDEQGLLARFLDWHGAQTAKLIRAKKKIIVLLNEQKQAIIHRAVTRGLDPNVRLKPSGIPWLGDVPEGWEVKPLKHWAGINRRTLSQNTDPDYAFDYVDISAVATGYLSATPERMRFEASPSRARRIVQQGDTLISTVRTYLKAIYHVDRPWPDLVASTGFAVLTPKPSIDARFFGFVLQSKTFVDQVVANSIGVAYPAISETRLGSLHVCLPPSRQEQEGIINHLQIATVDFDRSIEATQREIALIQEFQARLIADVVTGKLDVRAAAASLPAITELEPIDDLADGDDLDDAVDDPENEEVAA